MRICPACFGHQHSFETIEYLKTRTREKCQWKVSVYWRSGKTQRSQMTNCNTEKRHAIDKNRSAEWQKNSQRTTVQPTYTQFIIHSKGKLISLFKLNWSCISWNLFRGWQSQLRSNRCFQKSLCNRRTRDENRAKDPFVKILRR